MASKQNIIFEVYYSDLTPDAQQRLLEVQHMKNAAEGNYDIDIFPLFTLEFEDNEE